MRPLSLASASILLLACGAAEPLPRPVPTEESEAEAPPPLRARAVARYECDESGRWSLRYAIGGSERSCDDDWETAELTIVQRQGENEDEQSFVFRLGQETGDGVTCRAPRPCDEAPNVFTLSPGEPPRVEWSFSLSDEGVEHGSAAVLLCNEEPPPPCAW